MHQGQGQPVAHYAHPGHQCGSRERDSHGGFQRHRRWYTLFAYWFAAEPPFGFAAATREFRFAVAAGGETAVDYDVATKPGVEDMIQFPVGLVVDGERALVTWGTNRNTESRATRVALAELERGARVVGR